MPKKRLYRYWFSTECVPGTLMPVHKFYVVVEAGSAEAAMIMAGNIGQHCHLMLTLVE